MYALTKDNKIYDLNKENNISNKEIIKTSENIEDLCEVPGDYTIDAKTYYETLGLEDWQKALDWYDDKAADDIYKEDNTNIREKDFKDLKKNYAILETRIKSVYILLKCIKKWYDIELVDNHNGTYQIIFKGGNIFGVGITEEEYKILTEAKLFVQERI